MTKRKPKDVDRDDRRTQRGQKHAASRDSRRSGRFQQRYLRYIRRPKIIELQHLDQNRLWLVCTSNAPTVQRGNGGAVIVAATTTQPLALDLAEAVFGPAQRRGPSKPLGRVRRKRSF